MSNLRRWIARILMGFAVALPIAALCVYLVNPLGVGSYDPRQRLLGYGIYRVASRSMVPTVAPGQIVILHSAYYRRHAPQRGDIVVFRNSEDGDTWIKRVIGLPGETISIRDGVLLIERRELVEPYIASQNVVTDYSRVMAEQSVPEDSYFLLGDNRDNSKDARIFGATHRDDLRGKVVAVLR